MPDQTETLYATLDTSGFTAGELKIAISITNINNAIDQGNRKIEEHEAKLSGLKEAAEALTGVFAALAASFTFDKLVEVNTEYDRLSTELDTVTGSAVGAKEAMNELITFANRTPYTLTQVTQAFIELRNAGLDSSTAMMESLSNVASSIGRPLGDLTGAIASAAVGNTEALRGFGIELQATGDKFTATFQGMSTQIARNGPAIEKYLANLGNTVFQGDTDRQSQTIAGRMSTLQDSVENVLRAVGDGGFNDAFKGLISDATDANNKMVTLAGTIGHVLGDAISDGRALWKEYGSEIDAAGVAIAAIVGSGAAIAGLGTVWSVLSVTMGGLPLIIGGAAAAFMTFKDDIVSINGEPMTVMQALKNAWDSVTSAIGGADKALADYLKDHPNLRTLYNSMSPDISSDAHDVSRASGSNWNFLDPSSPIRNIKQDNAEKQLFLAEQRGERGDQYNETDALAQWNAMTRRYETSQPVQIGLHWGQQPGAPLAIPTASTTAIPGHAPVAAPQETADFTTAPSPPPAGTFSSALPQAARPLEGNQLLANGLISAEGMQRLRDHPEYVTYIQRASAATGFPVNLLTKTIDMESKFDPNANSGTGAVGLMQTTAGTALQPGYGVDPISLNDRRDPEKDIMFTAQVYAARALHDQQSGPNADWAQPIDWLQALTSHDGPLSARANMGNLDHMRQNVAGAAAALTFDDPLYQQQVGHVQPQALQAIGALQNSLGAPGLGGSLDYQPGYELRRAIAQQLIAGDFSTAIDPNDPTSNVRALRPDEIEQQYADHQIDATKRADYYSLREKAGQGYGAAQEYQRSSNTFETDQAAREASETGFSKMGEIAAQGLTVYNETLRRTNNATLAMEDGLNATSKALIGLQRSAASAEQGTRLQTGQTAEQTDALNRQKLVFDPNTTSYIADTRDYDALTKRQQDDPYGVNPHEGEVASRYAQGQWDRQRAEEGVQQRISDANQHDPTVGLKQGWKDYGDTVQNVAADTKKAFEDATTGMNDALARFIVTGKGGWASLAQSVEMDIAQMSIHLVESQIFKGLTSALGGTSVGSWLFGGGGGTKNAVGGVYGGGLASYDSSIVSSPTFFPGTGRAFASGGTPGGMDEMGEAGPEAIMPLRRGADGKLGVAVSGGGGGGVNVAVGDIHINNPNVASDGLDERNMKRVQAQLHDAVHLAVAQAMGTQTRPGGQFYGAAARR